MTIDTKLPASDRLTNFHDHNHINMTITGQIKILNKTIMQNEAQYDLERKAAKISTLSSDDLDKYKYLTGEDLGLKPSTIE